MKVVPPLPRNRIMVLLYSSIFVGCTQRRLHICRCTTWPLVGVRSCSWLFRCRDDAQARCLADELQVCVRYALVGLQSKLGDKGLTDRSTFWHMMSLRQHKHGACYGRLLSQISWQILHASMARDIPHAVAGTHAQFAVQRFQVKLRSAPSQARINHSLVLHAGLPALDDK